MRSAGPRTRLPFAVAAFVVGLALPPEASVALGGLRLSAYRVVLLVAFVPALVRTFSRPAPRWLRAADLCATAHGLWAAAALALHPAAGGIESAGIYLVESSGAYLLARAWVRDEATLQAAMRLAITLLLALLPFALVESVTGSHVVRDLARSVFGGPSAHAMERRFGLTRAFASFDHPILFGMYAATAFAFSVEGLPSRLRGDPRPSMRTALVGLAVVASVSSGAFAAVALVLALRAWERVTRRARGRWRVLLSAFAALYVVIGLASPRSPTKVFVSYLTFSPGTGYARLSILDLGLEEVRRNPWFGIGLGEWTRPDWMASSSIDNFWLATAMRYGVPSAVALGLAVLCVALAGAASARLGGAAPLRRAFGFALAGLCVGGCTVHFWNALLSLFCFLLGAGGAVAGRAAAPALRLNSTQRAPWLRARVAA